jgi:Mrp family chromosome partitioning ATPase
VSRHVEILRHAGLEGGLFGFPRAAQGKPPAAADRAAGGGVRDAARGGDQWKELALQVLRARGDRIPWAIGLASATAGEGTSYVAFHLSAELARSTTQLTLLLETNSERPSQAERFGVEPSPGLLQLMTDERVSLEDCWKRTAIEHLWVLPAGRAENGAGRIADWRRFHSVYPRMQGRFGNIVVDLPPVNLATDSVAVGPLVDAMILVVRADVCSREVIQNAVARLRRANPNLLGTVLNRRKFVIPEAIYRRL